MAGIIVRHCAPTLAGLKLGNLFSYKYDDLSELNSVIREQNRSLNRKGVYFVLVKAENGIALIYVFRGKQLAARLRNSDVQNFLRSCGYTDFSAEGCLKRLQERLKEDDFPHEIGVFLGYPLDDIIAFIDNKGANCKCSGFWKAYYNVSEAEKTFQRFDKCIRIYCKKHMEGTDLQRLTVAV